MKDTTTLSLGRETLLSFASRLVMAGIGFGGIVLFARVLGPDGLGVYKTAIAASFVIAQLSAGTGTAIKKRVSEVGIDPRPYFGTGLLIHGGVTLFAVGIFVLFRPFLDAYFSSVDIALGSVAVVFALGLFNVANRMYSGLGYPSMSSWIDTIRSVLTLAFQAIFLLLDYGALGLIGGFVFGTIISAFITMAAARVRPTLPDRNTVERVYSFARWSISNSLLNVGYGRADVLLINALVGSGPVGIYTTAAQMTMAGSMFSGSIRDSLSVKSSGLSSVGDDVREDLENAMSYAGLISIPILFGALAIPKQIMVTVFGPGFGAGAAALVGMTAFKLLHVYRLPFEAIAEGTNNPDLIFRTNVLVFVVYAPTAIILGLEFGLLGVIAGSIFGEFARLGVYQIVSHRRFGGVVLPHTVVMQIISAIVMFVVITAIVPEVVVITGWFRLTAVVGLAAGVYFVILLLISSHFRHTVQSALRDTVGLELLQE